MKPKKIRAVLRAFLLFGFLRNDESSKVEGHRPKRPEKHIYVSDISSISIQFKDASKYSMEQIIKTVEAAEEADRLMDK
ncbi:MAG: hypothetical protein HXS46_10665 [Theionarchaea archaeon]|nr:MAG: hypothetical protein AYK18_17920 [Theionarchaea archaeon DG-70]MBU7011144.1 hypothetical protein [Theionarchaea archaeon]